MPRQPTSPTVFPTFIFVALSKFQCLSQATLPGSSVSGEGAGRTGLKLAFNGLGGDDRAGQHTSGAGCFDEGLLRVHE